MKRLRLRPQKIVVGLVSLALLAAWLIPGRLAPAIGQTVPPTPTPQPTTVPPRAPGPAGAFQAALGCAPGFFPLTDIAFPAVNARLTSTFQVSSNTDGQPLIADTDPVPASLILPGNFGTPGPVTCGAVFEGSGATPGTLNGGAITYTLAPNSYAVIQESGGLTAQVSCGDATSNSCLGANFVQQTGVGSGTGWLVPTPENAIHIVALPGATPAPFGAPLPVLSLQAVFTPNKGSGTLTTNTAMMFVMRPFILYKIGITASPVSIPAKAGQGSTITVTLNHFDFSFNGPVLTAGAESGTVTLTTDIGNFGSPGQTSITRRCGSSTSFDVTSCTSVSAVLLSDGTAGTAQVAATFVGDFANRQIFPFNGCCSGGVAGPTATLVTFANGRQR
ncbi:MAG TPA: hypothetical protein VKV26_09595 [Dehalococcoidia bacterium]|nr:hypothetical protein [Dehalococcoidia bacterium]